MKFVDSNIFIYAFFAPQRTLSPQEQHLKEKSKSIITRIDDGEKVTTSVINLSEVANVLKTCFTPEDMASLFESLLTKENVLLLGVQPNDWLSSITLSKRHHVRLNDCLVAYLMKQNHIAELYSFDRDFTAFPWVRIVQV